MLPEHVRDVAWLEHEATHLNYLSKTYPDIKIDVVNNANVHYFSRMIHSDPKLSFQYNFMDVIKLTLGCSVFPQLQIENCDICNTYYGSPESWIISDLDINVFQTFENKLSIYAYKEFMLDNGFLISAVKEIDLFVIKFIRDHENLQDLQIDNRLKKLLLFS